MPPRPTGPSRKSSKPDLRNPEAPGEIRGLLYFASRPSRRRTLAAASPSIHLLDFRARVVVLENLRGGLPVLGHFISPNLAQPGAVSVAAADDRNRVAFVLNPVPQRAAELLGDCPLEFVGGMENDDARRVLEADADLQRMPAGQRSGHVHGPDALVLQLFRQALLRNLLLRNQDRFLPPIQCTALAVVALPPRQRSHLFRLVGHDLPRGLGMPAAGAGVEGPDDLSFIKDEHAAGVVDQLLGRRGMALHAAVHLRTLVVIEVELLPLHAAEPLEALLVDRIGARDDDLRLE